MKDSHIALTEKSGGTYFTNGGYIKCPSQPVYE